MAESHDRQIYLSILPSSPADKRAVLYAVIGSLLLFTAALPFVHVQFPLIPAFIASYQSSLAVVYMVTAVLLFSQFAVLRSSGILYLACGYLFTAIAVAVYALTYDDLFSNDGLFFPGPETTVWFYLAWHAGFPVFALLYALSDPEQRRYKSRRACNRAILWAVVGVCLVAVVLLLILTVGHPTLPILIIDARFSSIMVTFIALIFVACFLSIGILSRKKTLAVLDVWMMAILCAWMFDISLSAVLNSARFDFGYYAGRLYGLFAAGSILTILLTETATIQLRLSKLMRQQARDSENELQFYVQRARLFGAAVKSSNDAIITKSLNGTITGWNQAAERLFGFTETEAIGQNINIIVPQDRQSEVRDTLRSIKEGIAVENHETVRLAKDGRILDVSLSVSPVLSATGDTIGAAKVARDITDQKLNEEKFKLALDASPSGFVMIDDAGDIVLVNAETERLFGYAQSEILGQSVEILVPIDLRAGHLSLRASYGENPTARRMAAGIEAFGQKKSGERFPVEISLNPISTHKGIHILAVIVDISERKNAEKALRESERMAQGILDTAFNGFLQFDTNLKVIDLNKHTESIFGWDRENAIGQSILTIFANDQTDDPSWLALFDYLGGEEREPLGIRFEIPARTKTGDEISVELSLTKYHRNNEVRFNTFIRDVTEQRAAEAHFRQAKKMEAIGQLTGGVAHDFNNILTVITGTIEILAEAVADRPRLLNITKLIDSAATRGAELTKHLLAFSRKQPLRPRDVDINALTTETARLLRPTLGEQLHVALHLSNDTWPALVDPSQLTTAILNLALNARDASPIGATLTIRTGNAFLDGSNMPAAADMSPGDYVLIEVADIGSGMDRATLSKAFEPFFTTKEVGKGTGLGLSMVYGFVKQSEGHVQITSAPDVGTSVTIYLPRAVRAETVEIPECDTIDIPRGTETILIVEDDDLVRTYVVAQIERLGYRALPATDAVEARIITESDVHIDLLFTDVVLRGPRNGRQIADEALKQRPGLKVLFTSGYTQDVFNGGALVDSDGLLLAKPYRLSELARAIRRSLET